MNTFVCPHCGAMKRAKIFRAPRCNKQGHGEMTPVSNNISAIVSKMSPSDRAAWVRAGKPVPIKFSGRKPIF